MHTAELTYQGNISVTKATTISDNTVFAQLAQDLTLPKVSATAHAMGITSSLTDFPSEALGAVSVSPLEMADAYATLASGGIHHPAERDQQGRVPGRQHREPRRTLPGNRVFSTGEAYAATQVLKTVIQSGTGTAANYGCPAAGKTGTTSNFTDAYFDGYTAAARHRRVGRLSERDRVDGRRLRRHAGRADLARLHAGRRRRLLRRLPQPADPWHGQPFHGDRSVSGKGSDSGSTSSGFNAGTGVSTATGAATGTGGAAVAPDAARYDNPDGGFQARRPPSAAGGGGGHGGGGNGGGGGHGGGASGGGGTNDH